TVRVRVLTTALPAAAHRVRGPGRLGPNRTDRADGTDRPGRAIVRPDAVGTAAETQLGPDHHRGGCGLPARDRRRGDCRADGREVWQLEQRSDKPEFVV